MSSQFNQYERRNALALALKRAKAIRESGPDDSLNFNLRNVFSSSPIPEEVWEAARCMYRIQMVKRLAADAVVGVPQAGEPFAQALASVSGLPSLALEVWHDGEQQRITGVRGRALFIRRAILVDDYIVKGDWKRRAIEVLREAHITVTDILVLIDCEREGRTELEKMGCTLHPVFTISELRKLYSGES